MRVRAPVSANTCSSMIPPQKTFRRLLDGDSRGARLRRCDGRGGGDIALTDVLGQRALDEFGRDRSAGRISIACSGQSASSSWRSCSDKQVALSAQKLSAALLRLGDGLRSALRMKFCRSTGPRAGARVLADFVELLAQFLARDFEIETLRAPRHRHRRAHRDARR